MTPEEAISVIKTEIGQFIIDEKWKNALALAIEALEKQDVSDTISRNAAIDAVEHITSSMSVCVTTDECHGMKRMQRQAVIELANLPSAEPELTDDRAIEHLQSTGWMQNHDKEMYEMGLREQLADDSGSYDSLIPCEDTISRQAAIDVIFGEPLYETGMKKRSAEEVVPAIFEKVKVLPSAQSDIIRCNACKHWTQTTGNMPGFGLGDCDYLNAKLVSCNGFCYWAERRTDGRD